MGSGNGGGLASAEFTPLDGVNIMSYTCKMPSGDQVPMTPPQTGSPTFRHAGFGAQWSPGPILAGPGGQHPSSVLLFAATQSTNIVPFVSFLPSDIFLITKVGLGCIQTDVCLFQAPWGGELGLPGPSPWLSSPSFVPGWRGRDPAPLLGTSRFRKPVGTILDQIHGHRLRESHLPALTRLREEVAPWALEK